MVPAQKVLEVRHVRVPLEVHQTKIVIRAVNNRCEMKQEQSDERDADD